jgi:acyl-ACP thioesterase
VLDTSIPVPARGRTFSAQRRVRLSDMDESGRLRLDAVARFLQDIAIEDVEETDWGAPQHLWFIRRVVVDVVMPFVEDRTVDLVTWCSGMAAVAAGRRWSLTGDRGGRIEVDSVWIHLGPDQRPARLDRFGVYAEATGGRAVSTRLELPDPDGAGAESGAGTSVRWPLRAVDVDLHGHVNNAAYWQAVEERLLDPRPDATLQAPIDPHRPLRAYLDYRHPIDLGDEVELVETASADGLLLGFVVGGAVKAVARLEQRESDPHR